MAEAVSTEPTPTQRASDWLSAFGAALAKNDISAALAMFDSE